MVMLNKKFFPSNEDRKGQIVSRMTRALDMALSAHMSSRVSSAAGFAVVGHLAVKIYDELKELDKKVTIGSTTR